MLRAFLIVFASATLGAALLTAVPTPASAAPQRFCAEWVYTLVRGPLGYYYTYRRCLKWVTIDIPQPVPFVFGPPVPSPWITYGDWQALNPQPLPPKARRRM
jgi:hypothetical protein